MNKPIVHYVKLLTDVRVGAPCVLVPCDHPSKLVSNRGPVHTSPVLTWSPSTRCIVTRNTIYLPFIEPEKKKEEMPEDVFDFFADVKGG